MSFLKKHADAFIGAGIAVFLFLAVFILQGFAKYGLSVPFGYAGGDDFSSLVTAKLIKENGWFWFNDRIGAPFGSNAFDFPANLLLNFDIFVAKIISLLISNAVVANNLRYILIFPMCGISAFYVLRTLKINRVISTFGSLIFALTPYIFFRNVGHFSLSTAYFIPLSVLLCVWAIYPGDENYLKLDKAFFKNKKNILTLVFALLIANNGIGYYAFFSCFFLCVVALCNLITSKSLRSVTVPLKTVAMIVIFAFLALLPSLIYWLICGSGMSMRGLADAEIYGLKIAQLFIPLDSHGIGIIQAIIDLYNNKWMPLINENQGAYLGIFGIIGFLLSLIFIFRRDRGEGDDDGRLYVLSRMNLFAVLLATVGGFSSLLAFVLRMFRGYNRISVFIMFISVLFLCTVLQKAWESKTFFKTEKIKRVSTVAAVFIMTLSVLELLPSYGSRDGAFEYYKSQYESDKAFVGEIEETLGENAMVFQLPYHQTPEAGPVNNMADYHLYAGYINSETLRWSYGATKGRDGDMWLSYVSALPTEEMLNVICKAGFTGIYIDARAYTAEELQSLTGSLSEKLGDHTTSANGNLLFYDLRGYISENSITVDSSVYLDFGDDQAYGIGRMSVTGNHTVEYTGNSYIMGNGATVFGPYISLDPGKYTVTVSGSGLLSAEYDAAYGGGGSLLTVTEISRSDTEIKYEITVDKKVYDAEFRLYNKTDNEIAFSRVEITKNK